MTHMVISGRAGALSTEPYQVIPVEEYRLYDEVCHYAESYLEAKSVETMLNKAFLKGYNLGAKVSSKS